MIAAALLSVLAQTRLWSIEERTTISSFNDIRTIAIVYGRVYANTPNGFTIYDAAFSKWAPPVATLQDLRNPLVERAFNDARDTRDVALRVMRGTMTFDAFGRRWPITSIASADRPGTYFVGTSGNGLMFADSRDLSSRALPFGTLTRGTNALAFANGVLWFGGDGFGPRNGITTSDSALTQWTWHEAVTSRAPRGQVNHIIPGDTTWVSASDGLYAFTGGRWSRLQGLPSDYVRPLLKRAEGLYVGTRKGLALIKDGAVVETAFLNVAINSLAAHGDTVYVATNEGLFAIANRHQTRLSSTPTFAVAFTNTLVTLDRTGLHPGDASATAIRGAHDLRVSGNRLHVLGTNGFAEIPFDGNASRYLLVPGDIPEGPVKDVIRVGKDVWVATPAGATCFRWP